MRVKKLRQEMEKVRLLLELIRKRERTKKELVCTGSWLEVTVVNLDRRVIIS